MNLLEAWANWKSNNPPYVLDEDIKVLTSRKSINAIVTYSHWENAIKAPDFFAPGDRRLHLGLIPQPFLGNIKEATIYILLLNPGLGPTDYFGEYEVPEYREALLNNLKQHFPSGSNPFLFLDPKFSWHGGFDYWHGKLANIIERLSLHWNVSYAEASLRLGSTLASIELVPYHSPSFKDSDKWLRTLESVKLARSYVSDFVLPRVRRGEAIVIVTRKVGEWKLPIHDGVVNYTPAQARAAHLTPDNPGGQRILRHFGAMK